MVVIAETARPTGITRWEETEDGIANGQPTLDVGYQGTPTSDAISCGEEGEACCKTSGGCIGGRHRQSFQLNLLPLSQPLRHPAAARVALPPGRSQRCRSAHPRAGRSGAARGLRTSPW